MSLSPGHLQGAGDSSLSQSSTKLAKAPVSTSQDSLAIDPVLPSSPELATDTKSPQILPSTHASVRSDSLNYKDKLPSFIPPSSAPIRGIGPFSVFRNDRNLTSPAKPLSHVGPKRVPGFSNRRTRINPASSPSSLSSPVLPDGSLSPLSQPDAESKHVPEPELEPEPQFYISISASFSASKITYTRSIPSNRLHPCEPLPRLTKSALENDITLQIMDLISRKRQENLAFAAKSPFPVMEKEYRLSFSIDTSLHTGDLHSFRGLQPASQALCVSEAREIIASLEAIVARHLALADPPHRATTQPPDRRPKMLTLRFDICDMDRRILLSCVVASKTAPTYPLPPADQTSELMLRLWRRTSAILERRGREVVADRGRLRGIDRVREVVRGLGRPSSGEMLHGICISFDVLFGDADHKWFGGLCYGERRKPFKDRGELEALAMEVESVFRAEMEGFEKLKERDWEEDSENEDGEMKEVVDRRKSAGFLGARRSGSWKMGEERKVKIGQ